ncbi:hypothetical protein [Bacillus thuringiensis]|uniref:hypothetical protein n=1 Tax=Bacillus thuringiensis TaxID=1428 RepID=UPI000BF301AC|nr:hypothetical protein [Bacillus thuringiensis]PFU61955.1 hypothetical protein COK85_10060 [Bacillus thuringiensis]
MPSISDVYNIMKDVQHNTQTIHNDLQILNNQVNTSNSHLQTITQILNTGFQNLSLGIKDMIDLQTYNNKQNNAMICILEKISQNTCILVNEAHLQTGLQEKIEDETYDLLRLYEATHGNEAIEYNRVKEIHKELDQCCPKETPEPPCHYINCDSPGQEPSIEFNPFTPIENELK